MAKTYASLIPSIEQREAGWIHVRERLVHPPQRVIHPTITISREYGCEGFPLALRLMGLLDEALGRGWTVFDKALLDQVALDEQLSRDLLNHLGDESHAQDVLRSHMGSLTHDDAYARVVKHILPIALAGRAILVGRGAAVVCHDLPNCFHFRLVGSFEFRVRTLARRLELPLPAAEEMVRTQSKLREKFISGCLQRDITATRWYDVVFNNERQSVESIAQACLGLVLSGWRAQSGQKAEAREPATAAR
jgi:hypothetical protein